MQCFLCNLKVFLAPSIFGISYECGDDVKLALEEYKNSLFSKTQDNNYSSLFELCVNVKNDSQLLPDVENFANTHRLTLQKQSVFPDIQLLAVLECLISGLSEKCISILRENTYGHPILPSFRESSHKKGKLNTRLWTYLKLF